MLISLNVIFFLIFALQPDRAFPAGHDEKKLPDQMNSHPARKPLIIHK